MIICSLNMSGNVIITKNNRVMKPKRCFTNIFFLTIFCTLHGNNSAK